MLDSSIAGEEEGQLPLQTFALINSNHFSPLFSSIKNLYNFKVPPNKGITTNNLDKNMIVLKTVPKNPFFFA